MQVKTFRSRNLEDCLKQVKFELGRDAVMLQSRKYRQILGRFGPYIHEIVAADDIAVISDKKSPSQTPSDTSRRFEFVGAAGGRNSSDSGQEMAGLSQRRRGETAVAERPQFEADRDQRLGRLEQQIANLSAGLQTSVTSAKERTGWFRSAQSAELAETAPYAFIIARLRESGMADPVIRKLMSEVPAGLSQSGAVSDVRTRLAQRLKIAGSLEVTPGKMRVVAFFGATGVGKTTTIAKLAAQISLADKHSVGIITMDTHRVASAQQLQTYGEILNIPVRIAYNRVDLIRFLSEYATEKREIVLLDTAGRSPSDTLPISEMAGFLDGMSAVYRYLTVPATLSARNFDFMVERFSALLNPDAIILTKLDETADSTCLGHLYNVQAKLGIPLAYITNGQKVPDDLLTADAHAIAARVLSTAVL